MIPDNSIGKLALITGASAGIGEALARLHASRGGDLILVARRRDRLETLQKELTARYKITVNVISLDLATSEGPEVLYREIEDQQLKVDYLVNNAGFSLQGYFNENQWTEHEKMIRLMILSMTKLIYLMLPGMLERGNGRIMNVSSSAAFAPGGPLQTIYYASKSFIVSFSQGLAGELEGTGITVTALCPGATATEFEKVSGLDKTDLFSIEKVFSAEAVAKAGYEAMLKGELVRMTALTGWNKFALKNMRLFPSKRILQQIKLRQERTK